MADTGDSHTGNRSHQSNRVHQLPGEKEPGDHGTASAIIPTTSGLRAAPQPDSETDVPDAELQQNVIRSARILLIRGNITCAI